MLRVLVGRSALFRAMAVFLAAACTVAPAFGQAPIEGQVRAEVAQGYGRVVLSFPRPVRATATVAGGVLIVRFDQQVALPVDLLAARLAGYVAAARLDPDRTSMRLALGQALKADVKHAAEQIFLDLLPVTWNGGPPALPADVVAAMDARLRNAVATSGAVPVRQEKVMVRLAKTPGRHRLLLESAGSLKVESRIKPPHVALTLMEGAQIDDAQVRAELAGYARSLQIAGRLIAFDVPEDTRIMAGPEDGAFVVDMVDAGAPMPAPLPPAPPMSEPAAPNSPQPANDSDSRVKRAEIVPVEVTLPKPDTAELRITPRVPAAVFEREGLVHVVLGRTRSVKVPPPRSGDKKPALVDLRGEQNEGWSLVTFRAATPGVLTVSAEGDAWRVAVAMEPTTAPATLSAHRETSAGGQLSLSIPMSAPADPIWLDDPESSSRISVIPMLGEPQAMAAAQRFVEFVLPQTAMGLVVEARSDDIRVTADLDQARIGREAGLTLSENVAGRRTDHAMQSVFDADLWKADRRGHVLETGRRLLAAAAEADKREKTAARLQLASFYVANLLAREAGGVLAVIAADDAKAPKDRRYLLLAALAHAMQDHAVEASRLLADAALTMDPEAQIISGWLHARGGRVGQALQVFRGLESTIERLPEALQGLILPDAIDAALSGGDTYTAAQLISALENVDADDRQSGLIPFFQGRLAEIAGRNADALAHYVVAARMGSRPVEARARLHEALLAHTTGSLPADQARVELETVGLIWRRDGVEVASRARLATMAAQEGRWRDAFLALRRTVEIQPEHPVTRALQDEMGRKFEALFLGHEANRLNKIEALAIFDEFRTLIPPGVKGDAIARRLADRMTDLDLLPQAIELLDYQVRRRLKGADRASVAAQLAMLQLVERRPQDALTTLRSTRFAGVALEIRQMRLHLEARALGELSRIDLALELLGPETGIDAERVRGDLYWRGKRWAEAAETYERAHGDRWQAAEALADHERHELLRAAIAYVLAGDRIGTDRLRSKYMAKMAESADGELFKLVTIDNLSRPDAFRNAARQAVSAGSLNDLLDSYRKRFLPGRQG